MRELESVRASLERKLASEFAAKAPAEVVARERARMEAAVRREDLLRRSLKG